MSQYGNYTSPSIWPNARGPRILSVCYDDYANLAQDHTKAMLSAGLRARCQKLKPHAFAYTDQAEIVPTEVMGQTIMHADVVIVYHSSLHILAIVQNFVNKSGKPCAVIGFHTGTTYREKPGEIRKAFDDAGTIKHLTDQCEFLIPESGKDLIYLAAAIDHRALRSQATFPEIGSTYVIGHYPSKSDVKGTEKIRELMGKHGKRFQFRHSLERVDHRIQISRMSQCDIYLELFQTELGGQPYGCYGVTAFEAAALGRVVMTQNIHESAYREAYGCGSAFLLCNTEEDFAAHLDKLAGTSARALQLLQQDTYEWLVEYHSLEATGRRFAQILGV